MVQNSIRWLRSLNPVACCLPAVLVGLLFGCRRTAPPSPVTVTKAAPILQATALPLSMTTEERVNSLLEYYRKPVMGRRESFRNVERIVRDVAPLVEGAARQPEVQPALQQLAADNGWTLDEARLRWMRMQEADLLLEAGGNPDDVSSANAVGVAQWILETGRRAGLKIDIATSKRLTVKIDALARQIALLDYQARTAGRADARSVPSALSGAKTPQEAAVLLPRKRAEREMLRAKRRQADPRYDPKPAIFAHTRYLLGLYSRFPNLQWILQAFHGGEAGVQRTLKRYLGASWPGSAAASIRQGNHRGVLTFEEVYLTATPRSHAEGWSYLFGRGDDHRHYWWKARAAEEAIALYRRDSQAFRQAWEALLPGRAKEAIWYPNGPSELSNVLRPQAKGLLRLIQSGYAESGGKEPLRVGDTVLTAVVLAKRLAVQKAKQGLTFSLPVVPQELPGGGPPADFNYHQTGWAFDLMRPKDNQQRKRLDYALGYLQDRQILWQREETEDGPQRYHIVPNPRFANLLAEIGRGGQMPRLVGL